MKSSGSVAVSFASDTGKSYKSTETKIPFYITFHSDVFLFLAALMYFFGKGICNSRK